MFRAALPSLRPAAAAARTTLRTTTTTTSKPTSPLAQQIRSQLCTSAAPTRPRILPASRLVSSNLLALRRQSGRGPIDNIDAKREERIGEKTLKADPGAVSVSSTTLPMIGSEAAAGKEEDDHQMMSGINSDLQTIRDTFSLEEVPRQAYYMGLAGVLPYMATSLSTVYCAYEINRAAEHGTGFLMTEQYATALLHVIEPIQVGYGAVIISFLGAIHWGLEWASFGGTHGYPRYMIGVLSTALAWPTIFMPVEYALISQFLVFNFLYYTDSRASKRGWAPPWYGVYRFVLTFVVGGSLVLSLIGRGHIADRIEAPEGSNAQRFRNLRNGGAPQQSGFSAEEEEEQEGARARFLGEEGGDDDEEEEEDDE